MSELFVMRPKGFELNPFIDYLQIKDGVMAEIGSFAGESAEYFAKSGKFKKIYCIDPWMKGYDDTVFVSHQDFSLVEKTFDDRMKPYPFVEKRKGFSNVRAKEFPVAFFDMVYIDGNHAYNYVIEDITLWLPKVKKGGYIAGHDYGIREGVAPAVNKMLGKPEKIFPDTTWVFRV